MENIVKPRIGFIGVGSITDSHIEAAISSGFEVYALHTRKNDNKMSEIAAKYNIKLTSLNLDEFINWNLDAIGILVSPNQLSRVYSQVEKLNIPILIEKPVGVSPRDFDLISNLNNPSTLVGFNRRFLSTIQKLKGDIYSLGECSAFVEIPELVNSTNFSYDEAKKQVMVNSVHVLDLLLYLFGPIKHISKFSNKDHFGVYAINALIKHESGTVINLIITFGVPGNTSIICNFPKSKVELKPLENYSKCNSMIINKSIKNNNIKRYTPKIQELISLYNLDNQLKPGFEGMYSAFMDIVQNKKNPISASLIDAKHANHLANILISD